MDQWLLTVRFAERMNADVDRLRLTVTGRRSAADINAAKIGRFQQSRELSALFDGVFAHTGGHVSCLTQVRLVHMPDVALLPASGGPNVGDAFIT